MSNQNNHPHWWVYIIECSDTTYYTGITPNIEQRLQKHNSGKGASYTRGRGPVKLVYSKKFLTHAQAAQKECTIKKLTRQQKYDIIKSKQAL